CLPEVEQITTEYGPIALVWFDTPGGMDKKYAEKLVEVVHRNQPGAYVSGRVGHGMGDYTTLGDMEIPKKKVPGLWETVDVTNDAWGYAWYDHNWKSPTQIVRNVVSTIARGGTYMLNLGLKGDGNRPAEARYLLERSGQWIRINPEVVYHASPSPWQQAFPWGDAVVQGNQILFTVFEWPSSGHLLVPGIGKDVKPTAITLKDGKSGIPLTSEARNGWLDIRLPEAGGDPLAHVIALTVPHPLVPVDTVPGIDPYIPTMLTADFAHAENGHKRRRSW